MLQAVWQVLGQHEDWLSTAVKTSDPSKLSPIERKPILVVTEEADEQQKVFYDALPVGGRLRLFGSAHTHPTPKNMTKEQLVALGGHRQSRRTSEREAHKLQALVEQLLVRGGRRWRSRGQAIGREADNKRLRALVDHAHADGLLGALLRAGWVCARRRPGLGNEL